MNLEVSTLIAHLCTCLIAGVPLPGGRGGHLRCVLNEQCCSCCLLNTPVLTTPVAHPLTNDINMMTEAFNFGFVPLHF